MEPDENGKNRTKAIDYLKIYDYLMKHIIDQSKKRQLPESVIVNECIQFHMENAGT